MLRILSLQFIGVFFVFAFSYNSQAQESKPAEPRKSPALPEEAKPNPEEWVPLQKQGLLFRLSTDKQVYRLGEKVVLRAELKNKGDTELKVFPISKVFGNFPGEGITIKGPKKIEYVGMHKNSPLPKKVILPPQTTISSECLIDARFKGFGGKGKYQISCSTGPVKSNVSILIVEVEE